MIYSPDGCVSCLPASVGEGPFRDVTRQWLDEADPEVARFRKLILASGAVVAPDRHGRLVVPPRLVALAGLGEASGDGGSDGAGGGFVHWIGNETSFEVWSAKRWDAQFGTIDMGRMAARFNQALTDAARRAGGGRDEGNDATRR